ncbi:hypothetical protein ABPG72_012553 [Tetrahymena utriculariae]
MDSLNLSPIKDGNSNKDNNSVSPNSDLNSNQLPQSIEGTPYRSQESIKYQQNHTPSRELGEIQQKLTNSPGLDGLVRKCNQLKVQSQAQAAVTSQFYQQNLEHSLDIRQQMLATNHLLPPNFHRVQDQEIQQIFGVFTTPCKDNPEGQQKQNTDNKNYGEAQENQQLGTSGYKERLSLAPIDPKLILSQKIVSPNIQQAQQQSKENNLDSNLAEEKQVNAQGDQQNIQNVINPLFAQSLKSSELNYESKFQRILQSSSPTDQYKQSIINAGSALSSYQISYSSLKWDVQQQQQQFKPKKDYKNNFQTYLSLIGLGLNRSNHHGSSLLNTGNNLYFANKGQTQLQSNNSAGLYRVSSTERQSGRNFSQIGVTINNNNNTNNINNINSNNPSIVGGNKRRTGLEGIIDKINNKKDYLFQKKSQKGIQNQNSLLSKNQVSENQSTALSSSNNANNLIKLSRIHPNSHQSSKQAELEGTLEKIRLISMQRNINYSSGISKENEQQQKTNPLFKSGFQTQQQQPQLIQPIQTTAATSSLRPNLANATSNYFPSLGTSIGTNQRYSNTNQILHADRFQTTTSTQLGLTSTAQNFQNKQQILSQPISSILSSNINNNNLLNTQQELVRNKSQQRKEIDKQQPKQDILLDTALDQPQSNVLDQQVINFDAFEDYDEKANGNTQESDVANIIS